MRTTVQTLGKLFQRNRFIGKIVVNSIAFLFCIWQYCNKIIGSKTYVLTWFYFRFPLKDADMLRRWVTAVRRDNFTPTSSSCLCSDHFALGDYQLRPGASFPLLKAAAVPSIFSFPSHLQVRFVIKLMFSGQEDSFIDAKSW